MGMLDGYMRLPEVIDKTGLGRSSIYRGMASRTFPSHYKLGSRAVGWLRSEVIDWLTTRQRANRPN